MAVKYVGGDDPEWLAFRHLKLTAMTLARGLGLSPAEAAVVLANVAVEVMFEASLEGFHQQNLDDLKQAMQAKLDVDMAGRAIGPVMGRA